jgi:hypothetical protein
VRGLYVLDCLGRHLALNLERGTEGLGRLSKLGKAWNGQR